MKVLSKNNKILTIDGNAISSAEGGGDTSRLDNIVSILRQLAKRACYTEDVTPFIAELDSYFDDSGIIKVGNMLTVISGVNANQNDETLSIQ